MKWEGGSPSPKVTGLSPLPGVTNYFIGNDSAKWRTNIANYERIEYQEIYPGIDLAFYGNQQQLEYDFVLSPGANPDQIRLNFEGVSKVEINSQGELVLQTELGPLVHQARRFFRRLMGRKS